MVRVIKKPEKFRLTILAANLFLEKEYLDRVSDRVSEVYPKSGLPGTLNSVSFPVPVFVNKVQEANCTEEKIEEMMKCFKENKYCKHEQWEITEGLSSLTDFNLQENTKHVFCFIFKDPLIDSHGDVDDNKRKALVSIRYGRTDAIVSTILHEIYELIFFNSEEDLHCESMECFMNPESVSLVLCDKCNGQNSAIYRYHQKEDGQT